MAKRELLIDQLIAANTTKIEFRAPNKNVRMFATPYKDFSTNEFQGIRDYSEEEKRGMDIAPATSEDVFEVYHGCMLSVSNPRHKQILNWLLEIPEIVLTEEEILGAGGSNAPLFYIYDPDRAARLSLNKTELELKAMNFIAEDTEEGLKFKLRMFDRPFEGYSKARMKADLYKLVKNNVTKMNRLYESEKMDTFMLVYAAIDKKVISHTPPVYSYGTVMLGSSEELVVEFLHNPGNKNIKLAIQSEVNPGSVSKEQMESIKDLVKENKDSKDNKGDNIDTSGFVPSHLM